MKEIERGGIKNILLAVITKTRLSFIFAGIPILQMRVGCTTCGRGASQQRVLTSATPDSGHTQSLRGIFNDSLHRAPVLPKSTNPLKGA